MGKKEDLESHLPFYTETTSHIILIGALSAILASCLLVRGGILSQYIHMYVIPDGRRSLLQLPYH
jgi:hypothetical protein